MEEMREIEKVRDIMIHFGKHVVKISYFEDKNAPLVAGVSSYLDEYWNTLTLKKTH
jgi:hypothetical protein